MLRGKLIEQDFDFIQILVKPVHVLLKIRGRQVELITGRSPRALRLFRQHIHCKRPGLQERPEGGPWIFTCQERADRLLILVQSCRMDARVHTAVLHGRFEGKPPFGEPVIDKTRVQMGRTQQAG